MEESRRAEEGSRKGGNGEWKGALRRKDKKRGEERRKGDEKRNGKRTEEGGVKEWRRGEGTGGEGRAP